MPPRLIGGTKGGMISKLHGVCHSKGGPLRLHLSEGQCSDFTGVDVLHKDLPPAATVIGDQGYDSDKICKMLVQQGIPPCIPPRRCCKKPVHYSKRLDRKHHKIENLFSRQKDWWRLATRYERCAHIFRSAIFLAAIGSILIRSNLLYPRLPDKACQYPYTTNQTDTLNHHQAANTLFESLLLVTRYGIGEWYGRPLLSLTPAERHAYGAVALGEATPPICPFRPMVCNKRGDLCSIQPYQEANQRISGVAGEPVILCPTRFEQDRMVVQWLAEIVGSPPDDVMLAQEVPFMLSTSTGKPAGKIDLVIASRQPGFRWFGLEFQAVYFSGAGMEAEFMALRQGQHDQPPYP